MKLRTLTLPMLGLAVLIVVAILAFPKLNSKSKVSKKNSSSLVAKTTEKTKTSAEENEESIQVEFGIRADFDAKPKQPEN